ncbi:MAG: hypothetical protein DMG13_07220 [Acidobacteria bacterium]|nr:MAG: hypothetical protein DMG13_07220 [Acidobacteriota bacterium]
MRRAKIALWVVMFACLSLRVVAQKDKPQTPPAQNPIDDNRMEKAHESLFAPQAAPGADASRLTEQLASTLPTAASSAPIPRKNFIDEHIFGRIERDRIPHAALAGDEEFLRRAYLDATGLLPPIEKINEFVVDKDPQKRDKLIDALIGSDEFTEQWAWFWGDLFRTKVAAFHIWTKQWLKVDRPYNDVFYDIVTVTAKNHQEVPASGFYNVPTYTATRNLSPTDADNYYFLNRLDWIDEFSVDLGRVFLGINMDCFSCHNGAGHADSVNVFLGRMKREQFHQQAAFFGNYRRLIGTSPNGANTGDEHSIMDDAAPGYNTAYDAPYHTAAESRFPRNGKSYQPAFILTGEKPKAGENPRKALGRILPSHIQFARAAVNLIWGKLMVVGFVEPYDNFDLDRLDPKNPPPKPWTIQPTNVELLNALAEDFRTHNYTIHRLMKLIMKSNAYQLSAKFEGEWKESYVPYYPRRFVRVLSGPEAVDLIAQATGAPYSLSYMGEKLTRIKQLSQILDVGGAARGGGSNEGTPVSTLMQAFFQTNRDNPAVTGNKATSVQAMLMMASPVVTKRIRAEGSTRVAELLKSGKSDNEIVDNLFLASVSRHPTAGELEVANRMMAESRKEAAENIQWSLLNSAEFLLNH